MAKAVLVMEMPESCFGCNFLYCNADADIIAEVNFYYEDEIHISYQDKIKTGRAKKDYGIRFFD